MAAPSNVGRGPTLNPTYEPTPKPVEDIPCTATVESGIPDDKVWEWGQDVELKIKMCHWYSYSYGVVDVLLYGDEPNADPVDSLAQYQSVHDNTLTVKYTVPQCTDQDLVTGECNTAGLNFPDNDGVTGVVTSVGSKDSFKLRIIEYGHGLDTGGWRSTGSGDYSWDRDDLVVDIRTKHLQAPSPEPTKAPSQDGTIDCFHTALFAGTGGANQVEMNKIRKFSSYGAGTDLATTPLAPGDSIFANIEYWPLDRYSSGRGTNRGGTYKKATAKEGQLRWSEDNDQGRFVYPFVDGPIATTDGALRGGGTPKGTGDPYAGECSTGGRLGAGSGTGCKTDTDCTTAGETCVLVAYGAVCSDDMTTACSEDNDCTAPATCVLKPTGRDGHLTEPEPMHTYWPFGYNRTTHAWTYGYCPSSTPTADNQCCCETDATGVAYFEDCDSLYPTTLNWMTTCSTPGVRKMVPLTRQNVTVAFKATKVTLRLCRGECHNDKNLGHVADAGDRKKGDKKSADDHGFFGALKYDVEVDANGPLGYGADGAALEGKCSTGGVLGTGSGTACFTDADCTATGESCARQNGPYESNDPVTLELTGSGGHPNAQRYGVVGGKVPLTLPTDLETADDYRILVHEESTGLTCRSDYFTIANAGEVPTPSPVRKAPPTPRPTPPRATHAPTPAPTPATITFAPEPQFWQKGSTQTVEIRIGDVDQAYSYGFGAVVDLLLYEADDADPVGTLAVYAQVAGNKLSVDYAVPAGLAGADFRLRAIEYTRGLDVYSKPFAIGDGAPTAKPTAAPTGKGLQVSAGGDFWVAGDAATVSVRYTGVAAGRDAWGGSLDTDTCYFDVVLMQGDAQVSALATGAESRNCKLTLSVDTTSLAEGTYSIQASEYTRGWVGASDDVAVVAPAPRPTDAPVAAPVPTAAPTPSGISVTESLAGATVAAGAAFTAELAYTGNLQKADGVVTLRICEGSATPYAGPADAYDSCAQAGANLATAEAASDGSWAGSGLALPADLAAGT